MNKGEIRSKADFERKKKEIEDLNREEDTKERPLFSLNMEYKKGSFLEQLKDREGENPYYQNLQIYLIITGLYKKL